MLHELSITDLGVIESARIDLGAGLTCVTGETGAGKTMVLTGLGLILGGKTESQTVRTGAQEALVEAVMDAPVGTVTARLDDAGVTVDDDGTVVVARTVGATTRSRSTMGGRTVPQALLAEVASELVTVHGQSDQARLRSPSRQRETLDHFGGADHAALVAAYTRAWRAWREAADAVVEMEQGAEQERLIAAGLRDDLTAIDALAPEPGELDSLVQEARVLENAEEVRTGVAGAHAAIAGDGDDTVAAAIDAARRALAEAARHDDALEPLVTRLDDSLYTATDVGTELASYLDRLEADPARLDQIHARRSDLTGLMRRLGVADLDEVLAHAERARARVTDDDDRDGALARRRERERRAHAALQEAATALTHGRRASAARLAAAVSGELELLAMPHAQFSVEITATEPGPHGADEVAMLLAAHPGAPARPVAQAASGGELSRIMLAIEVSLAGGGDSERRTFVFDEVDAGVGGRAAVAVGERLAVLARTHQVIVVTHLAQVAAYADTHVVVTKASDDAVTRAQVHPVDGDERVQEIARLLSGQDESTTALAHALELLEGSSVAP